MTVDELMDGSEGTKTKGKGRGHECVDNKQTSTICSSMPSNNTNSKLKQRHTHTHKNKYNNQDHRRRMIGGAHGGASPTKQNKTRLQLFEKFVFLCFDLCLCMFSLWCVLKRMPFDVCFCLLIVLVSMAH